VKPVVQVQSARAVDPEAAVLAPTGQVVHSMQSYFLMA
jgi:hypothetical protein